MWFIWGPIFGQMWSNQGSKVKYGQFVVKYGQFVVKYDPFVVKYGPFVFHLGFNFKQFHVHIILGLFWSTIFVLNPV